MKQCKDIGIRYLLEGLFSRAIFNNSKMHFFTKTALFCTLFCTATAIGSIDASGGVSASWTVTVPDPQKIPNHNRLQLFHDILVEDDRHSLAFLRWNDATEYHPTKCNLTVETHAFDGQSYRKTCDVYPPPSDDNKWVFAEKVTYLSRHRVLLTWREEHKTEGLRMISQVIFTDTCLTSEYINVSTYISLSLSIHTIVRHSRTFEIIFSNGKVCPINYYCRLTFDHDGNQLSQAQPLAAPIQRHNETLTIIHAYPMGKDVVFVGNRAGGAEAPEVYSPINGWTSAEGLFYKNHWYSNSSGFATFCWQLFKSTEFRCKWLDSTRGNGVMTLRMRRQYVRIEGIHNKLDGEILLMTPGYEGGTKVFIDEGMRDGGCKRLAEIPYNHGLLKRVEMSIVDKKRACFSLITKKSMSGGPSAYPIVEWYKFTTTCTLFDGTPKLITCGQGYL